MKKPHTTYDFTTGMEEGGTGREGERERKRENSKGRYAQLVVFL